MREEPTAEPRKTLRRGWTTGACATAATRAAYTALLTGEFPDPVTIELPRGQRPSFALTLESLDAGTASAGIIKDAGDDPDVTHGATVISTVRRLPPGSGVVFRAGEGVGTVTRPGLPIDVGEAAINPVPRRLMTEVVETLSAEHGVLSDLEITVSVPGGEALAAKTWNPRLGILGGLSILGTTGVVVPYSCSAWIHSIHRGIDVARAAGFERVAGCTGSTSEAVVQRELGLPDEAMLDMGDFAGGLLKYLRRHPVKALTLGGGFGKFTKLAMGHMDLHSARSQVDFDWLATQVEKAGGDATLVRAAREANTANEVLIRCAEAEVPIAAHVAGLAREAAIQVLRGAAVNCSVWIVDRRGNVVARSHG